MGTHSTCSSKINKSFFCCRSFSETTPNLYLFSKDFNMSDVEGDVPSAAPLDGPMDINTAFQEVLKQSLIADGLARGLREAAKALDKRQALLCVLAENCDEPMYKKLVSALCLEHGIPMIKVDSNMKLSEWTGLCKIDKEGKARKVVKCSACVIRDWGKEGPANDVLQEYLKSQR